jgi:hypothetical protein
VKIIQKISEFKEQKRVEKVQKQFDRILPDTKIKEMFKEYGDFETMQAMSALYGLLERQSKEKRYPWEIL